MHNIHESLLCEKPIHNLWLKHKKFELMLTRHLKAYSSSG